MSRRIPGSNSKSRATEIAAVLAALAGVGTFACADEPAGSVAPETADITATAGGNTSGTLQMAVSDPEYAVLFALYVSTNGDGWTNNDNWFDTSSPGD